MPNLPDLPGKDLVAGTATKVRSIAAGAGTRALAVGGALAQKVLSRGGQDRAAEPARWADRGPAAAGDNGGRSATLTDLTPPEIPTGEGRRGTATAPEPTPPKPKPAKPAAPRPPKPDAAKPAKADAAKPAKAKPSKPKPKAKAAKPKAAKAKAAKAKAKPKPVATGTDAPVIPGEEPGDQRGGKDPHHALNNPVVDPDLTEYPDPFDKREDPRDPVDPDGLPFGDEPHPPTGAESTSEPHPDQDPEAGDRARPPRRENLDD